MKISNSALFSNSTASSIKGIEVVVNHGNADIRIKFKSYVISTYMEHPEYVEMFDDTTNILEYMLSRKVPVEAAQKMTKVISDEWQEHKSGLIVKTQAAVRGWLERKRFGIMRRKLMRDIRYLPAGFVPGFKGGIMYQRAMEHFMSCV